MEQKHKILRIQQVMDVTGLKKTNIIEKAKSGGFPSPISLGERAIGWIESEVQQWINECITKSRSDAE